jgi:hypothetical protein
MEGKKKKIIGFDIAENGTTERILLVNGHVTGLGRQPRRDMNEEIEKMQQFHLLDSDSNFGNLQESIDSETENDPKADLKSAFFH